MRIAVEELDGLRITGLLVTLPEAGYSGAPPS